MSLPAADLVTASRDVLTRYSRVFALASIKETAP